MMNDPTKDVEIGGRKYRISRFTAQVGSYIAMTLFTRLLPFGLSDRSGMKAMNGAAVMPEDEFVKIQNHCLRVCSRADVVGEKVVYEPVLMEDGRFAFPDMQHDILTALGLTVQALVFNIAPFFSEGGLGVMTQGIEVLSSSTKQPRA